MSKIGDFIKQNDSFYGDGVGQDKIIEAEQVLGLKFSSDYRDYLFEFGSLAFDGHELTGLLDSRTDVVEITQEEKRYGTDIPLDFYVIERTGIDGIIIWQNHDGDVFQSSPFLQPQKINDSLISFLIEE